MLVPFLNADGAVGSPGISWVNETTSGIYRAGLNDQRWASSGVDKIQITADVSNPLLVWNVGDASFRVVVDVFSPATIIGDWLFQGDLTMEGPLVTDDSTTARSGFNIPTGVEPTVPAQGDIWVEAGNIFARINGVSESLIGSNAIAASGAISRMARGDGSGGWIDAGANALLSGGGQLDLTSLRINSGSDQISIGVTANVAAIVSTGGTINYFRTDEPWRFEEPVFIQERGSFDASVATFGQLWVDNNVRQDFYFVDDTGIARPIISPVLTFTLDWSDGFSDTNVNTYSYTRVGDMVTFWLVTANLGNSNAGNMGTGDSIPSLIRPETIRYVSMPFVDNGGAIVLANVAINPDGTVEAFAPDGSVPPDYGNNWTGSGVKGPIAGSSATYSTVD